MAPPAVLPTSESRPPPRWMVPASLLTGGAIGLCAVLVWRPEVGLAVTWAVAVPALPLVFLLAPRVWRNVCPFALANQLPRITGVSRGRPAPAWIARHGFAIAGAVFIGLVVLRKAVLDRNGPATAAVIVSFLLAAFLGGLFIRGKAGWCGSVCPLYPVQRVYGRAPLVRVQHAHCRPCVGCMQPCVDLDPQTTTAFESSGRREARAHRLFIGAAPGLVVGYFATPAPPSVSLAAAVAGVLVPTAVSATVYALLAANLRATNDRRRRALAGVFAAAAFAAFYVFTAPVVLRLLGVEQPAAIVAVQVLACAAAAWWWVWDQRRAAPPPSGQVWLGAPGGPLQREETVVRFVGADGARRPVAVGVGESLAVAARRAGVAVPSGCGVGACGADALMVLTGRHNLSDPTPEEVASLRRFDMPDGTRLACVARVTGEVTVTPRVAAPSASPEVNPSVSSVVIVGNGIAGLAAAQHVRRLHPRCEIHLVGREPHHTYNRMALTDLVTGHSELTDLGLVPEEWFAENRVTARLGTQAVSLDVGAHELTLDDGSRLRYNRLILATGATPVEPPIEGLPLAGSHLLRTAEDALAARAETDSHPDLRNVIVLGAGPLGVETATALTGLGARVTLIDRHQWPLPGLLDRRAGDLVRSHLRALGVDFETGVTVVQAYGETRIAAVGLSDGRQLPCDVLLVCTGTRPNVDVARTAGLAVRRGVVVDATMRTSHPHVFAIGDVAEFGTQVTGLWYAAVEQASVAAEHAVARLPSQARRYRSGPAVTRLHLPDLEVVAIGRSEAKPDDHAVIVLDEPLARQYRKIIVAADGAVSGGIVVNDAEAVAAVESAASRGVDARPLLDEVRAGDLMTLSTATKRSPARDRLAWLGQAAGIAVASVAVVAAGVFFGRALGGGPASAPSTPIVQPSGPPAASGGATGGGTFTSAPATIPGAAPNPTQGAASVDARVADVLQHPRIRWSDEARSTLLSGGADPRLLALLVALAADHDIAVAALPEVPGAQTGGPHRVVAITALDGAPLSGGRADEIAMWFNAQQSPYRPVAVLVTSGSNPAVLVALDTPAPIRPATP